MQSLQDDEDGVVSHCIDIHAASSFYFRNPPMIIEFIFAFSNDCVWNSFELEMFFFILGLLYCSMLIQGR
jgi:hypothetical protein